MKGFFSLGTGDFSLFFPRRFSTRRSKILGFSSSSGRGVRGFFSSIQAVMGFWREILCKKGFELLWDFLAISMRRRNGNIRFDSLTGDASASGSLAAPASAAVVGSGMDSAFSSVMDSFVESSLNSSLIFSSVSSTSSSDSARGSERKQGRTILFSESLSTSSLMFRKGLFSSVDLGVFFDFLRFRDELSVERGIK